VTRPRGGKNEVNPGPAGVVIVDASALQWWSSDLRARLKPEGAAWHEGMPCCDVLDCAANTSPGEPRCLTAVALANDGELPERRWAAAAGSVTGTISARAVREGSSIVVFELRLAAHAPRTRAISRDGGTAEADIAALGRLSVRVDGTPRDGDWLLQRAGEVLRYLIACRTAPSSSEAIADALWPERGPSAIANVRYCVFKLREQLGSPSLIVRTAAGYRLDPGRLKLDVDVFERRARAGLSANRSGDAQAAEAELLGAMRLYRGDFLADDPYGDWAFTEREYLRGLACEALGALADISLARGQLDLAADRLQRLARLEPFDSRVHRQLIDVCLRRGRNTEAVRHYTALRTRLQRAFGERPDFELSNVGGDRAGRVAQPALASPARLG
jgi:DNA-binding SARP family transcriptional activator